VENIGPIEQAADDRSDDLAYTALGQAQGIGKRGARRRGRGNRGRRRGGYSGPGPDELDPQLIGGVMSGLFAERGWQRPVTEARVFADWPGLVGADVARHCQPTELRDGELRIAAESTAWATQLRLMSSTLLARLAAELGPEIVARLSITGPIGPSWKHGGWSVRGARGPRDTYG
jgi:predicted nucleic acid-binding Zn ribbon protein